MEVNVTTNKKEQVKAWVNKHKTDLVFGGIVLVTGGVAYKCIFKNDLLNAIGRVSKGARRFDACVPGTEKIKLSDLGKIGIEAVEVAGLKPEAEVTGLMIFTK